MSDIAVNCTLPTLCHRIRPPRGKAHSPIRRSCHHLFRQAHTFRHRTICIHLAFHIKNNNSASQQRWQGQVRWQRAQLYKFHFKTMTSADSVSDGCGFCFRPTCCTVFLVGRLAYIRAGVVVLAVAYEHGVGLLVCTLFALPVLYRSPWAPKAVFSR